MTPAPTPAASSPSIDRPGSLLRVPRWWVVIAMALLVVKLVLVSHDEIEIRTADDSGYAVCASVMYWGAPFQPYSYARQPSYPLFIVLSQVLGVPMRLSIELVWFGASLAIGVALRRCGLSVLGSLSVYALTLFSPISFWMFNRLLPDGFYAACILALLAGLVAALMVPTRRSAWRWGGLAAFAAALGANTRQETPLIYGLLGVAGVLALFGAWRWFVPPGMVRMPWTRFATACLLPLLATLALTHAFSFANYQRVGMYVTYDLVAPGLKSLYRELLSIPPKTPRIDVPVPRDVREIAYAASPTFNSFKPFLDGDADPENAYKAACKRFAGVDDEFGAWTVWGLRRAAWRMSNYKWSSGGEMDAVFARAADELAQARRAGAIPHRRVLHEYLPPEYDQLWSRLPGSITLCWKHVSTITMARTPPDPQDPWYVSRIDAAAVRRWPTSQIGDAKPEPPTLWHQLPVVTTLDAIKAGFGRTGEWLTVAGAIAAGLLAVLAIPLLLRGRVRPAAHGVLIVSTLVLAAILSRMLLFAVLDVCGIFSQQRYMFVTGALLILAIPLAVEAVALVLRPSPSLGPSSQPRRRAA
jgi:hypothetical protein